MGLRGFGCVKPFRWDRIVTRVEFMWRPTGDKHYMSCVLFFLFFFLNFKNMVFVAANVTVWLVIFHCFLFGWVLTVECGAITRFGLSHIKNLCLN